MSWSARAIRSSRSRCSRWDGGGPVAGPRHGWLIVALGPLLACSAPPASPPAAESGLAGRPAALAAGPRLFVTNERSGDLSVIDLGSARVVATVRLGKRPRGIRLSPDHTTLYVALSGSPFAPPGVDEKSLPPPDRSADGIGVVDVAQLRLVKVIPAGSDPEQLAVSKDGTRLFIANEDAATASVLDLASGRVVASVPVGGEPEGVEVRPDGAVVYVTSEEEGEVFAIDTAKPAVLRRIRVDPRPRGIAFLPDGSRAYVTCENGGSVAVIDAQKHARIAAVKPAGESVRPMGIVASPDGRYVYVTTGRGRRAGDSPWGLALVP